MAHTFAGTVLRYLVSEASVFRKKDEFEKLVSLILRLPMFWEYGATLLGRALGIMWPRLWPLVSTFPLSPWEGQKVVVNTTGQERAEGNIGAWCKWKKKLEEVDETANEKVTDCDSHARFPTWNISILTSARKLPKHFVGGNWQSEFELGHNVATPFYLFKSKQCDIQK